jgi:hypothetical protein
VLAVSDPVALALVTGIIGLIGVMFQAIMAYFLARLNKGQGEAAIKADEVAVVASRAAGKVDDVKTTLEHSTAATDVKLDGLAKTGDAIHTLVNNAMGVQLKLNAVLARRLASMANATPGDIEAAKAAEALFDEHMKKQAIVDQAHKGGGVGNVRADP